MLDTNASHCSAQWLENPLKYSNVTHGDGVCQLVFAQVSICVNRRLVLDKLHHLEWCVSETACHQSDTQRYFISRLNKRILI